MKKFFPLLLTLLLSILLVYGLSFTSAPSINSGNANAFTTESLICAWTSSGDTTQTNITWYRDGNLILNETGVSSPYILGQGNTTKDEVWNCTITIANSTARLNASDTITIANSNPTALVVRNETLDDIGNTTTILEDVARVFNVTTTDADGDEIEFSGLSLPSGSSLGSSSGLFSWTPNSSQIGQNNVTFIALDNNTPDRGSSAKDIVFIVQEVNDNPAFNPALTNQTATEGQVFTYNIVVSDEESDFPINFTISSDLPNLIINTTSNTTATITFSTGGAPVFTDGGNHTVNVTINDTRGGLVWSTFNLEVSTINQLPNLSEIPNATGTQGVLFTLIVNATDLDVNDTLSFAIASTSCLPPDPWSINKLDQITVGNLTRANASVSQVLNNSHVACNQVNITVTDSKNSVSRIVTFNITNVNDAPTIHDNSTVPSNTGNSNISTQIGFVAAPYSYQVNATDPDQYVSGGENINYTDNTTLFNIGTTTGLVNFTPNSSILGNHSISITVTDDEGLNDTAILELEIRNNSAPTITDTQNQTCFEDILCTVFINAVDSDGDSLTFSSNDTTNFNLSTFNTTAGYVNTTYNQSFVGSYSINITATDIRGASDTATIVFTVNNTNDAPVLNNIIPPSPIVATHLVFIILTATDEDIDILGGAEALNFTDNSTLFNVTTSLNNITNQSSGSIIYIPIESHVGNHSINISVADPSGATDWQVISFNIFNDTEPPNITTIRPYGTPVNSSTQFAFANRTDFPGNITNINLTENMTVLFNHTTIDDTTALVNLTYLWQYDGNNVSTNHSYNRSFDFFSSGNFNLTLTVYDDRLENATFTWELNISNINRPPLLLNPLENVSISSTETFTNFLLIRSNQKFIDPDDDTNSNNQIDTGNESNTLSYSASSCSVADISISGASVTFTPEQVGTCNVAFTAVDTGGLQLVSNTIVVNVTAVPEGNSESPSVTTSSGGGGGGGGGITRSSSSIIIPRDREVDKPKPLSLIAPDEITLYRNRTITVPIYLENTWNKTLEMVDISATSNYSDVEISFDNTHFDEILSDERKRVDMTVAGYRLGDNFEVHVNATVEEPIFEDNALILFNSIEQTEQGDQVNIKVTFARDLLASNEECQELGELIGKAESEASKNNYNEATKIIDTVINGCKYLVSKARVNVEKPSRIDLSFLRKFSWFYFGAATLLVLLIGAVISIEIRIRKERGEDQFND